MLTALSVAPIEFQDWQLFDTYFSARIADVAWRSGLEHQKAADVPAELAGEIMPMHLGELVGEGE